MNDASLLVLGASDHQLDTIRTAQRLGLRVVTVDNRPDNPGHRLADATYCVSSTDGLGVLAIAQREQIHGVISPCTDVAAPTAALVSGRLGLIGPPLAATLVCCDKCAFRNFQQRAGVPHPCWHEAVPGNEQAPGPGTWIVKPNQSSGSKGIEVVVSPDRFAAAVALARRQSLDGRVICERFHTGHQGTLEGFLREGQIVWSVVLDRETAALPYVATHGHRLPTRLAAPLQQQLLSLVEELWSLLGVTDGPFDCDFVATDSEILILEMSPRLGGNSISRLVQLSGAGDLVEQAVRWVCGDARRDDLVGSPHQASAVILLGVEACGRLDYDECGVKALQSEPWVLDLVIERSQGAWVEPFIDGRQRCGAAFVCASNRDELDDRVRLVRERIGMRVRN